MVGTVYKFYEELIYKNDHILIAGMTGSGKSVIINGMLNSILYSSPEVHKVVLIDPKRVELFPYERTPYCLGYGETFKNIEENLQKVLNMINWRLDEMTRIGAKFYPGCKVHVFVDEFAELMLDPKAKRLADMLQSIAQIGRAANVQLVCATQCPLASVIPTRIKVNFGITIGLHTRCAQDSRNILDVPGCEKLPKYGKALIKYADKVDLEETFIPKVDGQDLRKIIAYRQL